MTRRYRGRGKTHAPNDLSPSICFLQCSPAFHRLHPVMNPPMAGRADEVRALGIQSDLKSSISEHHCLEPATCGPLGEALHLQTIAGPIASGKKKKRVCVWVCRKCRALEAVLVWDGFSNIYYFVYMCGVSTPTQCVCGGHRTI